MEIYGSFTRSVNIYTPVVDYINCDNIYGKIVSYDTYAAMISTQVISVASPMLSNYEGNIPSRDI